MAHLIGAVVDLDLIIDLLRDNTETELEEEAFDLASNLKHGRAELTLRNLQFLDVYMRYYYEAKKQNINSDTARKFNELIGKKQS